MLKMSQAQSSDETPKSVAIFCKSSLCFKSTITRVNGHCASNKTKTTFCNSSTFFYCKIIDVNGPYAMNTKKLAHHHEISAERKLFFLAKQSPFLLVG